MVRELHRPAAAEGGSAQRVRARPLPLPLQRMHPLPLHPRGWLRGARGESESRSAQVHSDALLEARHALARTTTHGSHTDTLHVSTLGGSGGAGGARDVSGAARALAGGRPRKGAGLT